MHVFHSLQKPLEQVLAAENVVLFNSLMVQKNIDLEFQALELLKTQLGHAPDAYDPNSLPPTAPYDGSLSNEEEIIQQALEESKREFEVQKYLDEEEMEKLINIATKESLASEKEKQLKLNTTLKKQPVKTSPKTTQQAPLVSMSPVHAVSTSTSEAASMWLQSAKNENEQAEEQQKVSVRVKHFPYTCTSDSAE